MDSRKLFKKSQAKRTREGERSEHVPIPGITQTGKGTCHP